MGLGSVGLQTSQKKEQSGAPFASTAADNGLSVDTVTGRIVLGNDTAAPGSPAALLSNREISLGNTPFSISLIDQLNLATTRLNGNSVRITSSPVNQVSYALVNGGDTYRVLANGSGHIFFSTGVNFATLCAQIQVATGTWQFGSPVGPDNGATLQVNGNITGRRTLHNITVGAVAMNRDLDSMKVYSNTGALTVTAPDMAAGNFRSGFLFYMVCSDATGTTFQAAAGQTIRFGSLSSSVAGTLTTTDLGAYATLVLINSTTWFTESFCGAWNLT